MSVSDKTSQQQCIHPDYSTLQCGDRDKVTSIDFPTSVLGIAPDKTDYQYLPYRFLGEYHQCADD